LLFPAQKIGFCCNPRYNIIVATSEYKSVDTPKNSTLGVSSPQKAQNLGVSSPQDSTILIYFEPSGINDHVMMSQSFSITGRWIDDKFEAYSPDKWQRISIDRGQVQLLSQEHWTWIKNDTTEFGGQYLLGTDKVNPQLFCVASSRNLIRDFIDGSRTVTPYGIEELIDKCFNVNLLTEWSDWLRNPPEKDKDNLPSRGDITHYIKQIMDRLDRFDSGEPVDLPEINRKYPTKTKRSRN
jgi:hypothetical protein